MFCSSGHGESGGEKVAGIKKFLIWYGENELLLMVLGWGPPPSKCPLEGSMTLRTVLTIPNRWDVNLVSKLCQLLLEGLRVKVWLSSNYKMSNTRIQLCIRMSPSFPPAQGWEGA